MTISEEFIINWLELVQSRRQLLTDSSSFRADVISWKVGPASLLPACLSVYFVCACSENLVRLFLLISMVSVMPVMSVIWTRPYNELSFQYIESVNCRLKVCSLLIEAGVDLIWLYICFCLFFYPGNTCCLRSTCPYKVITEGQYCLIQVRTGRGQCAIQAINCCLLLWLSDSGW